MAALTLLLAFAAAVQDSSAIKTFLEKHCADCHGAEDPKGKLNLEVLRLTLEDAPNVAAWIKIHDRVRDGEMPPAKKKQPTSAEKQAFLQELGASLTTA